MTSRCIVVAATPRSGSSIVANVLRTLGVFMGYLFQPEDELNTRGYWEDQEWQMLSRLITKTDKYDINVVDKLTEKDVKLTRVLISQRTRYPVWGFKTPRACFWMKHLFPILAEEGIDARVVRVLRRFDDCTRSLQRHSQKAYNGSREMTYEQAHDLQSQWEKALLDNLVGFQGKKLTVIYEDLLLMPCHTVGMIAAFAFSGLWEHFEPERVNDAVDVIDPMLCNFRMGA